MAHAKISLIGLYKYGQQQNIDIFSGINPPAGIDRSKLINTILMNGAEFEVLYPDMTYFQFLTGVWSDKWQHTMDRWIKALSIDYNPLENYDRMEDWIDADSRQDKTDRMDSSFNTTIGWRDYGNTDTHNVSAYDASTLQPKDEDSVSGGELNETGNQNMNNGSSKSDSSGNSMHTGRTHGNIGVTTSQQMLESELDIARFNIYNEIADLFLQEFCIYTY